MLTNFLSAENPQLFSGHGTCDCRCACRAPSEVNSFSHGSHFNTALAAAPAPPCDTAAVAAADGVDSPGCLLALDPCANAGLPDGVDRPPLTTSSRVPTTEPLAACGRRAWFLFLPLFGSAAGVLPTEDGGGCAPRGFCDIIPPLPLPPPPALTTGPLMPLPPAIPVGPVCCQLGPLAGCSPAPGGKPCCDPHAVPGPPLPPPWLFGSVGVGCRASGCGMPWRMADGG